MADQGRWFKLWCSAPSDDKISALPPALRWAWAVLGCHIKEHGYQGTVKIYLHNAILAAKMGVEVSHLLSVIEQLPNAVITHGDDNGTITVTWKNWRKYQEDSTVKERVKRWREKTALRQCNENVTGQEEKRRDEKRIPPIPPVTPPKQEAAQPNGFADFWNLYPKKKNKGDAEKAWKALKPDVDLKAVIGRAILRWRGSAQWQKDGGQFIPYPASWLRAKGWEDQETESGHRPMRTGAVNDYRRDTRADRSEAVAALRAIGGAFAKKE